VRAYLKRATGAVSGGPQMARSCRDALGALLVVGCCCCVVAFGGGVALSVLAVTDEVPRAVLALGVPLAVLGAVATVGHCVLLRVGGSVTIGRRRRRAAAVSRILALEDSDDDDGGGGYRASAFL
jgi:hypothetical protein